jgi:glycosyltransferase involved in cell wall biosynthesis
MNLHIIKIIHGYPPYYNAGSEVYSQSICNELSKNNKVSIFTREENTFDKDFGVRSLKEGNTEIYYLNIPREKDGYRHIKLDKELKKIILKLRPDIAHIGHLNHLSTGLIDVLKEQNILIVFTLHDFWLMCPRGQFMQTNFGNENFYQLCDGQEDLKCAKNCYKGFFSGKEEDYEKDLAYWSSWIHSRMKETKNLSQKVNLFIAPSKYLMNRFVSDFGIPKNKIEYLDYGFPLHYLKSSKKKFDNKEFSFGYIGTHIPAKGVNLLIDAFLEMKEEANLKIWGRENGQNTNSLKRICGHSNKNARIEWMGEYANSNIADMVFSEIDAIIVPSIWGENSPLVIHEAQACHIPVITANFGGMSEYVQHEVNGLLFEHRNTLDLCKKMDYAVQHQDKMKEFGRRGYLYSADGEVPNIENHCKELINFYQKVIEGFYD